VGPYNHDMACCSIPDGGDGLQLRMFTINVLNKQPLKANAREVVW
jgi:hypothetical protein